MAARNQIYPSAQHAQSQQRKQEKGLFKPAQRGFGLDAESPPAFANMPGDALVKNALTAPESTPIQAKLTVGAANDVYEQEADRVSRQVVSAIRSPQFRVGQSEESVQRQEEAERPIPQFRMGQLEAVPQQQPALPKFQVQARSTTGETGGSMAAPQAVEQGIQHARGKGQPLTEAVRGPMEQAFGANFGGVRVHTDTQADQLNQSIQAKAFTTGQDVFFRAGAYQPESRGGQELLAHELTHVVQQRGGATHEIRRAIGFEYELGGIKTAPEPDDDASLGRGQVMTEYMGVTVSADQLGDGSDLEFITPPIDEVNKPAELLVINQAVAIFSFMQALHQRANAREKEAAVQDDSNYEWIPLHEVTFNLSDTNFWLGYRKGEKPASVGVLQMTGGVDVKKLPGLMSGTATSDYEPYYNLHELNFKPYKVLEFGHTDPGIYAYALEALSELPEDIKETQKAVLASVITLMSMVILGLNKEINVEHLSGEGNLIAKTDYRSILQQVSNEGYLSISRDEYLRTLLGTCNKYINRYNYGEPLNRNSLVGGERLDKVEIADWINRAYPGQNSVDLFTPDNYPGSKEDKSEVQSFGKLGNRMDEGPITPRVIIEWKSLNQSGCRYTKVSEYMLELLRYIRHVNM